MATTYLVCQRVDGTGTRLEIKGRAEANGPVQAAKAVAKEGTFVCIPYRNWSEVKLGTESVERTTAVEIEPDLSNIPIASVPEMQTSIDEVLAPEPPVAA